jgi:hypothetical protein
LLKFISLEKKQFENLQKITENSGQTEKKSKN